MPVSKELGAGGAGFHGDQAKRVRTILNSVETAGEDVDALKTSQRLPTSYEQIITLCSPSSTLTLVSLTPTTQRPTECLPQR
jgi:hypothetical protein